MVPILVIRSEQLSKISSEDSEKQKICSVSKCHMSRQDIQHFFRSIQQVILIDEIRLNLLISKVVKTITITTSLTTLTVVTPCDGLAVGPQCSRRTHTATVFAQVAIILTWINSYIALLHPLLCHQAENRLHKVWVFIFRLGSTGYRRPSCLRIVRLLMDF